MSAAIHKFIRCQTLSVNRGFVRPVTTSQHKLTEDSAEEIKIPVPWGHIAGKWWGGKISTPILAIHGWQDNASSFDKLIPLLNTSSVLAIDLPGHGHSSHLPQGRKWWGSKRRRPILCIHGWQDNANSFKTLIPQLSPEFSYLAVDFPGHGLSSHLPKGAFYNIHGSLDVIRRVQFYFKWEKVSMIGHSYGAGISFLFASFFPSSVDFFVAIDCIKPLSREPAKDVKNAQKSIEKMLMQDSMDKSNSPLYSKNDLMQRWTKATENSLTEKSCEILMERGAEIHDGLYRLTRDGKLKFTFTTNFTQKEYLKMAESVNCSVLYIKAKDADYFEKKKDILDVLNVLEKRARYFQQHEFPGTHHIHLNTPQIIAPVINSFMSAVS